MAHIVSAQNRRAEAGKGLGSEVSPTYRVELPAGEQGLQSETMSQKKNSNGKSWSLPQGVNMLA